MNLVHDDLCSKGARYAINKLNLLHGEINKMNFSKLKTKINVI